MESVFVFQFKSNDWLYFHPLKEKYVYYSFLSIIFTSTDVRFFILNHHCGQSCKFYLIEYNNAIEFTTFLELTLFCFQFLFKQVELEVERHVLRTKVLLSDKTEGLVFTRSKTRNESNMFNYICHLCGVNNLPGERCLQVHIAGRKHQMKLQSPIDAKTFRSPITRNKPQSN